MIPPPATMSSDLHAQHWVCGAHSNTSAYKKGCPLPNHTQRDSEVSTSPYLHSCFVGLKFDSQGLPDPQLLHVNQGSSLPIHPPCLAAFLSVLGLEAERQVTTIRVRWQIPLWNLKTDHRLRKL